MDKFETWWEREGQEFLFALNTTTDDDIKLVAEVAWKNGAYCAEQAEQEPVAWGVDWGKDGDQSCVSIIKKHSDGTCEVVAVEYSPNSVRTKDLTDDEISKLRHKIDWTAEWSYVNFARAVIAADREKNK